MRAMLNLIQDSSTLRKFINRDYCGSILGRQVAGQGEIVGYTGISPLAVWFRFSDNPETRKPTW